ncbi:MAG: short chain dehydrogenase [Solirubrobacterales bacterium]|jgi:NAD(P)-dependent dehydrogenase (short-subunit alcohol dehydrogenase family)|nr:short chain dehydrogenase [Solirubrobacterales bacterium]
MRDFEGRNVLVVGGSGAIGASVCRMLGERGAQVMLTYARSRDAADRVAALLEPVRLAGVEQVDITDPDAVERLLETARERMGGVDAVINTAGYMHGLHPFVEMDLAEVRDTVALELFGVMHLARAAVPLMREAGYGRLVTVASDSGKVGAKGVAASAAARGGVIAFSKSIAREVADKDICVNVVCPGPTDSALFDTLTSEDDMSGKQMRAMVRAIPKRRAAQPDEVAAVALFLASEAASFVTGQAISASGGLTMN